MLLYPEEWMRTERKTKPEILQQTKSEKYWNRKESRYHCVGEWNIWVQYHKPLPIITIFTCSFISYQIWPTLKCRVDQPRIRSYIGFEWTQYSEIIHIWASVYYWSRRMCEQILINNNKIGQNWMRKVIRWNWLSHP